MAPQDGIDRPHILWWIAIVGGLTILALQGFSAPFYAWWTTAVNPLPGQTVMMWLFLGIIPIHIAEAVFCYRLASRLGMPQHALGWAVQTFVIGFPSTRLLMKRARPGNKPLGSAASS
jgi:hypothetical protein